MNEASGVFNPLGDDDGNHAKPPDSAKPATVATAKRAVTFYKPSALAAYEVPADVPLIGDLHVFKGSIAILGGSAGVGKSFALSSLAIAGATGTPWFGLPVHRRFKTMILQAENGLVRLGSEYREHCAKHPELDEWVRVSGDVDFLDFMDKGFCDQLRAEIVDFAPDVFVLDPWNRATSGKGDEQDYRAAFDAVISCLPTGDQRAALMIAAHTKKPRDGKSFGRGLLNDFSGSLVLGSVPRAAFVLQPASDAPEGNEFVFTCCKNNNGPLGKPSAWRREGMSFTGPIEDFDFDAFQGITGPGKNVKIELHHLEAVFDHGKRWLPKAEAIKKLMVLAKCGRSAAYNALDKVKGQFADSLRINPANGEMNVESPWPDEGGD